MNKVIIVGHPSSGLAEVEEQLRLHGVKAPMPSRREGLLPVEIADSLCRAYLVNRNTIPTSEADFQQIQAGPLWNDLVLDLQLGNAEQELWGWADPQSIHLLDYWHELDSLAAFVLVFDEPQRALAEAALHGREEADEAHIRQQLEHWAAYNGALLRFYLRHPKRCILANTSQVLMAPDQLVEQLRGRISLPMQPVATGNRVPAAGLRPAPPDQTLNDMLALATPDPAKALGTLHAGEAERFLLDCHLTGEPACLRLYEELQASADLPYSPGMPATNKSGQAWKAFVAQRRLTADILIHLHSERYLLLTQLHQVQEELELLYLNGRGWNKQAPKSRRNPNPNARLGAADRVKQQLSYRLGHTLVKRSRSAGGLLAMPFSLVGEVRRYRSERKRRKPKNLPPIHAYDDAEEAERVKNQLSYRLGNVIVRHAGNPMGWFKLPFAMRREIKAFHRSRKSKTGAPSSKTKKP